MKKIRHTVVHVCGLAKDELKQESFCLVHRENVLAIIVIALEN